MIYTIHKDLKVLSTPKERECHDVLSSTVMNMRETGGGTCARHLFPWPKSCPGYIQ